MRGPDREKSLAREVYFSEEYFSYRQLWSFVEQIYHIQYFRPKTMVEIGIGNGFVSEFMKMMSVYVKTVDINPNLKPDIVSPLQDMGHFIKANEFDLITCCEVLEHIPFEEFETSIHQFSTLSDRLFLTLPVYGEFFGFGGFLRLPKIVRWDGFWLRLPPRSSSLAEMHYWEIDYNRTTSKREF